MDLIATTHMIMVMGPVMAVEVVVDQVKVRSQMTPMDMPHHPMDMIMVIMQEGMVMTIPTHMHMVRIAIMIMITVRMIMIITVIVGAVQERGGWEVMFMAPTASMTMATVTATLIPRLLLLVE